MFERTVGYYVPVMAGSTVGFARSLKDLSKDIGIIRPTLLIAVPQIYEGIRTKMQHQLEEQGRLARLLVNWTLAIGWERFSETQKRPEQPHWWHATRMVDAEPSRCRQDSGTARWPAQDCRKRRGTALRGDGAILHRPGTASGTGLWVDGGFASVGR